MIKSIGCFRFYRVFKWKSNRYFFKISMAIYSSKSHVDECRHIAIN